MRRAAIALMFAVVMAMALPGCAVRREPPPEVDIPVEKPGEEEKRSARLLCQWEKRWQTCMKGLLTFPPQPPRAAARPATWRENR